jgi:hypothetical protein
MEVSHLQTGPDGGKSRIGFLYVVRDTKEAPLPAEVSAALRNVKLNIPAGRVEVFLIPPAPINPINEDKTLEQIILSETKVLTEKYPEFAVTHTTHDWESSYVLWPILVPGKELVAVESSEVEFEVTWDYLNVLRATSDQINLMINCVAICLSRYRSLSMAIRSMQSHADNLISLLDGKESEQSALAEKESEHVRRALKADLLKVDATMSLHWGYEFRLLDAISEAWNLSGLERKAKESEETIAQLAAELEKNKEVERFQEQSRQTQKLNLYVATFALVQVPLTVLQFSDRWVDEDTKQLSKDIAIAAGTVAAGIWLLMWFTHRKLKRAEAEAG